MNQKRHATKYYENFVLFSVQDQDHACYQCSLDQQWPYSKLLNSHLNAKERKDRVNIKQNCNYSLIKESKVFNRN